MECGSGSDARVVSLETLPRRFGETVSLCHGGARADVKWHTRCFVYASMRLRYPSWYVLLLALAWPAAVLSVFSVFALAFVLVVVAHALLKRRYGVAALAAGASPFGVACLAGAVMYFAGTATIASAGAPPEDATGLDPQSRAPLSEPTLGGAGHEWVWRWSSTLGVRTMAAAFGPMPGSYDGAFPAAEEGRTVLDAAAEPALTTRDAIIIDGQAHPLQPETVAWLQCRNTSCGLWRSTTLR